MDLKYCDICGEVIKPKDKYFVLGITEENPKEKTPMDATNFFQSYQNQMDNVEVNEICANCKKVYDYIFRTIRLDELKRIKAEVEQMYDITEKLSKPKEEEDDV